MECSQSGWFMTQSIQAHLLRFTILLDAQMRQQLSLQNGLGILNAGWLSYTHRRATLADEIQCHLWTMWHAGIEHPDMGNGAEYATAAHNVLVCN